jgi:hypothetical protein
VRPDAARHYGLALEERPDFAQAARVAPRAGAAQLIAEFGSRIDESRANSESSNLDLPAPFKYIPAP